MKPLLLAILLALACTAQAASPADYFAIQVVDDQTGRGVPMVELRSTSSASYYTDSNGLIAFYEPGLMDKSVWFDIASDGYEYPANGFGLRGAALQIKPGGSATLKIKRVNIAQRLYRITGQGIYRDTILLGRKAPIAEPLINAQVTGQDGILNAIFHDKLYWFYGDTNKLDFPLGNFSMTGATTDLPDKLDPDKGFDLHYFTAPSGFVRPMVHIDGPGVVWLYGVVTVKDETGNDHMVAYFERRKGLESVYEDGFVEFDDAVQQFHKIRACPLTPPIQPAGYPFRVKAEGVDYIYFNRPYPMLRVRDDYKSYLDLSDYESFTCLKPGTQYENKDKAQLDRDATGKLLWAWKKNTPMLNPAEQEELIKAGRMKREESPMQLHDAATAKPVMLNNCSCCWNAYRKRYVMIGCESMGATMLGEIWYAEANSPQGPWTKAIKIITHANKKNDPHDFYNPVQHSFLDRQNGQIIYLEGSYVNTFSGNHHPTPYYEYNQQMYRLDLADPRLSPCH